LLSKTQYIGIKKIAVQNDTCDCVICFSLWGVGLRIIIWWETFWSRDQHTTLQSTSDI